MTTTFPQLKLKTLVNFPTAAVGRNGIYVDSAGGAYFIDIDYSTFNTASSFPPGAYTLTWNPVTDVYLLAVPEGASPSDDTPLADALGGGPGVSEFYSRADHVHPASGGGGPAPSDALPIVEGTAAAGVLTTYSRADHVHPAVAGVTPSDALPLVEGTAAAGISALYSRADHVHPTAAAAGIDQNSKSANYTTVLGDAQKHIFHPSADTTARTFTIAANASVAYPIGTAITFVNQNSAGVITIAITSDTMRLAGPGTTGNRTLAANGVCTALKVTSTEWIISGTGLT
jgi:hypothetical protein